MKKNAGIVFLNMLYVYKLFTYTSSFTLFKGKFHYSFHDVLERVLESVLDAFFFLSFLNTYLDV